MELWYRKIYQKVLWYGVITDGFWKHCRILLRIENISGNGVIEITVIDNVLFTEIKFHDSGEGFKKEDLPHLFERFYRGRDASTAGYGIGMALCKTIITRQGGTITAKNHPDGGAVFILRFQKHAEDRLKGD